MVTAFGLVAALTLPCLRRRRASTSDIPDIPDICVRFTATISTREIPDGDEICVRSTATNAIGTTSSEPLCVPHIGATASP